MTRSRRAPIAIFASLMVLAPLAAGVTLALHFAFYTLLHVPLPWGWLEGIAW